MNEGYWGMGIGAGENYHLRVIIRTSSDYKGTVAAKLLSSKGDVLAETSLKVKNDNTWNDIKATLSSAAKDAKAKLALDLMLPVRFG